MPAPEQTPDYKFGKSFAVPVVFACRIPSPRLCERLTVSFDPTRYRLLTSCPSWPARTNDKGVFQAELKAGSRYCPLLIAKSADDRELGWHEMFLYERNELLEIRLDEPRITRVRVLDSGDQPVAGARVAAIHGEAFALAEVTTGDDGTVITGTVTVGADKQPAKEVTATLIQDPNAGSLVRWTDDMILVARDEVGNAAAVTRIGPDDETVDIRLKPASKLIARLVNDDGQPLSVTQAFISLRVDHDGGSIAFGFPVTLDRDGRLELSGVLPGASCNIRIMDQANHQWGNVNADVSDQPVTDAGDLTLKMEPLPTR